MKKTLKARRPRGKSTAPAPNKEPVESGNLPAGPPMYMSDIRFPRVTALSSVKTFHDAPADVQIKMGFRRPSLEVSNDKVAFVTTFFFRISAEPSSDLVMSLRADTEIVYSVTPGLSVSDQMGAFVLGSGAYHAWPYWRELVQTGLLRLGLPVIRLPLVYHDALPSFIIEDVDTMSETTTRDGRT